MKLKNEDIAVGTIKAFAIYLGVLTLAFTLLNVFMRS